MRLIYFLTIASCLVAGCGKDPYSAEQKYWHLNNNARRILHAPQSTPAMEWKKNIAALETFIRHYPASPEAFPAQLLVIKMYTEQMKFTEAREHIQSLMKTHPDSEKILSEATFLLGQSYEKEGKGAEAVQYYQQIRAQYRDSLRAFLIPLYIAGYYQKTHQDDKATDAYREAADYYLQHSEKFDGTNTGFNALLMATQCYRALLDWKNAANTLERTAEKYAGKQRVEPLLIQAAYIYAYQLKDTKKAEKVIERVKTINPAVNIPRNE